MNYKQVKISINILCIRDNKFLLGLLTKKWEYEGQQVHGVPGRDLKFGEKIGDAVHRNIQEEIGCKLISYKVIAVNENFVWENHYIGIGITAVIEGEPKLLYPDDWEKWEWYDADKIPTNLFPDAKNLIECFKSNKITVSE